LFQIPGGDGIGDKMNIPVTYRRILLIIIIISLIICLGCNIFEKNQDNENDNEGEDNEEQEAITRWSLWIGGTQLRGANIYQRRVYPELDGNEFMGSGEIGPPYIQEDFNKLSEMGANYVNISHPGIFSEKPPYVLDNDVLKNLKNLVEMIGKADMFVVISFRTGPGRSEFTFFWGEDEDWFDASYYNDQIWKQKSAQDAFVGMWKEAAKQFKDNPCVVGFDLMVEPNSNDVWLDLWEPDEFYAQYSDTLYDWNPLFIRITHAIREEDPNTPILVGGMAYSAVDWFPYIIPSSDLKTVYMIHQYQPHVYTHQEPDGKNSYPGTFDADYDGQKEYVDKNWLEELMKIVDGFKSTHGFPVACNEYGVVRWVKGGDVFMDDQMSLFEERDMNYALWVWDPSWEPLTSENNAFNFRFGSTPNNLSDLNTSPLIKVIKKYWSRNTVRPSNSTLQK
jgi:hypothetical protein